MASKKLRELVPTAEQIDLMLHEAHKEFFIANSVKTEIRCVPAYVERQ